MMTGLHSGSPGKMIALAPLLLIILVANTHHHVHASPRGKVMERHHHRQLRQNDDGRQLKASPEAPNLSNIFKMGAGKVEKSSVKATKGIVPVEAKGRGMSPPSSSEASSSSPDKAGKGKGKGKGMGQYDETNSKSITYTEKKSKSSSKGMSIHKISRRTADDTYGRQLTASNIFDNGQPAQVLSSQPEVFEDDESNSWLGLPALEAMAAQSSSALPITTQQVTGTLDCTLPDTGFFGEATSDLVIVPYLFQATLVNGTPLTIINRRIAPNLDRGMVEGILPYFFPCARRRRLQSSGITGISAMGDDIPLIGGLPCVGTQTNGDCYIFLGEMSVFVNGLTDQEAIEAVQGAIQTFIRNGGPQSLSPLVLNSAFVTDDLQTLSPATTRAPSPAPVPTTPTAPTGNTFSPTTFPPSTSSPGPSTGFPTRQPTGFVDPTAGPPSSTPAPSPSASSPSLTPAPFAPTLLSPTIAPFIRPTFPSSAGGTTFEPTRAPVGAQTNTNGDDDGGGGGGGSQSRSSESGIEKMDWWAWVLVGLAAVGALLCGMTYLNGAGGGPKRARPIAAKSSGPEAPDDDYRPPGGVDDDYQPPDLGAFNIEPTPEPSATDEADEFYDDEGEEEQEEEEEYEEEFAGEDEYGEEAMEYEEGGEFEGGEYGDEYGDEENEGEFEEESYYEEETEEGSNTPSFTNF